MAVESETIELKTISKFDPDGIDAAIAKYERLEMLHAKLSSLKIKVEPTGFTELNRELTQIQGAVARISAMRGFDHPTRESRRCV
jgi:pyruvate/2-oxoglutarate/acetoin dehydrogenase E1 component